jgi:hypothetical protein
MTPTVIHKMKLEPLRVLATSIGVDWESADTRTVLINKITAKQAEQPDAADPGDENGTGDE